MTTLCHDQHMSEAEKPTEKAATHLLHADVRALLEPAVHAVVPPGHVHRAELVPAHACALLPPRVAPEERAATEATDGAVVQVLGGAVAADRADAGQVLAAALATVGVVHDEFSSYFFFVWFSSNNRSIEY